MTARNLKQDRDNIKHDQIIRMDIVALLYKRGYTYRKIRDEVMSRLNRETYSLKTVHKDVQMLLEEWRNARINNIDDAVLLEIERLKDLQREAWDAWEKSKQNYEKQRVSQYGVPKTDEESKKERMVAVRMMQQKENVVNCGDPKYLEIIYKCGVEIRKLLGLYAPEKREVTGKDGKDLNPVLQIEVIDSREQVDQEKDELNG